MVAVALLGAMRMTAAHTSERQQAGAARMLADLIENGLAPEAPFDGAEPAFLDETVVTS